MGKKKPQKSKKQKASSKKKTEKKKDEKKEEKKKKVALFDIKVVPEHRVVSEEEKQKILEKYNITLYQLPNILKKDPIIKEIGGEPGDVVEIIRDSPTAGKTKYYRVIVE